MQRKDEEEKRDTRRRGSLFRLPFYLLGLLLTAPGKCVYFLAEKIKSRKDLERVENVCGVLMAFAIFNLLRMFIVRIWIRVVIAIVVAFLLIEVFDYIVYSADSARRALQFYMRPFAKRYDYYRENIRLVFGGDKSVIGDKTGGERSAESASQNKAPQRERVQKNSASRRKSQQRESRREDAQQGEPRQGSAKQGSTQQGESRQGSAKQGSTQQGETRQGSAGRGNTQQGESRQGSAKQENAWQRETGRRSSQQRNAQRRTSQTQSGQQRSGQQTGSAHGGRRRRKLTPLEEAKSIFSVEEPFGIEEIRSKRNLLLKTYHPDNANGSEEMCKKINECYDLLAKYAT